MQKKLASNDQLLLLEALKKQDELEEYLPHHYERHWKWYRWAKEFYDAKDKICLLTAANQVGKSSVMQRKMIEWATNKSLWKGLWDHKPKIFWYFYPSLDLGTVEVEKQWVQDFLPRGMLINSPKWGYEIERKNKIVQAVHFKSGVSTFLKSYEIKAHNLQATSVDLVIADEEMPEDLYPELMARLSSTDGYFWSGFTATLGQEFWRRVMEEKGDLELLEEAKKQQISMYECQQFLDGSVGHWPLEKIERQKKRYGTEAEIQRRVYGRFVLDHDREYPAYETGRNLKRPHKLPKNWIVYGGVDIGSGTGHPAAIVFIAVSPDFKQARVFRGWRGDNTDMIASDVLDTYLELKKDLNVVNQVYDYSSADFGKIASRRGIPFQRANKSRDEGIELINSLFKNSMLCIYDTPELRKLSSELTNLRKNVKKQNAKDDFCDALRYCVMAIPWDWTALDKKIDAVEKDVKILSVREQRHEDWKKIRDNDQVMQSEYEEWNELFEDYYH